MPKQLAAVEGVTSDVLSKLSLPEVFPRTRVCGVTTAWVPVPEASLDEYAQVVASKHYVGPS